jgi:hypothetical protein
VHLTYEILINLSAAKFTAAAADQLVTCPFVFTYRGTTPNVATVEDGAWWVVTRHNRDDRPDGRIGPSFSPGDAIRLRNPQRGIDQTYVSVAGVTIEPIATPAEVDRDGLWSADRMVIPG